MVDELSDLLSSNFMSVEIHNFKLLEPELKILNLKDVNHKGIINSNIKYVQIWRLLHSVKT